MLLLIFLAVSLACHPESRWQCDNPCENYLCDDPVCSVICGPACTSNCVCYSEYWNISYSIACVARCPEDQCESDACPVCETICPQACAATFIPLCEPIDCSWQCHADPDCPSPVCQAINENEFCPHPRCELFSERPACEYNAAPRRTLF